MLSVQLYNYPSKISVLFSTQYTDNTVNIDHYIPLKADRNEATGWPQSEATF